MDIKNAVAAAMAGMTPDQKIAAACKVLGKDVSMYTHLDNGRKSMTAGNLLRNAIVKDSSLMSVLVDVIPSMAGVALDPPPAQIVESKVDHNKPVACFHETLPFSGQTLLRGEAVVKVSPGRWVCINIPK